MLPIIVGFGIYQIAKDFFPSKSKFPDGIILGEEFEEAKNDSLILQGLKYDNPRDLYNSKNKYLPISLLTYEEEKEIYKAASLANDIGDALLKYVNVLFLDENYQVITSLLNKKASILEIEPQRKRYSYNNDEIDKTVKYIAYLIAFEDSNKDEKLNSADNHDLYLSDLEGKNLKKVTENINLERFDFINSNSQILEQFLANLREEKQSFRYFETRF